MPHVFVFAFAVQQGHAHSADLKQHSRNRHGIRHSNNNVHLFYASLCLQYGKDFYYRAHPEDLKKFYAAVDEYHAAYDALTEFESLNGLAAQMLPGESCVYKIVG